MKRAAGTVLAACLALIAAACGGADELALSRVFASPTWPIGETLTYQLRQRDEVRGTCTLSVAATEDSSRSRLTSLCASPDERYRDDRWVEVDSQTLLPARSERVIARLDEGKRSVFTATYRNDEVVLAVDADGKQRETTRALPTPSGTSPAPGHYDDVSLFWLVRGIPFAAGYEGAFRDVNAGNARVFTVIIRVTGTAAVEVPAGRFETWEVEVETESITQVFWVERGGAKRVIRARIERDLYELMTN